jgi:hypothetical protein
MTYLAMMRVVQLPVSFLYQIAQLADRQVDRHQIAGARGMYHQGVLMSNVKNRFDVVPILLDVDNHLYFGEAIQLLYVLAKFLIDGLFLVIGQIGVSSREYNLHGCFPFISLKSCGTVPFVTALQVVIFEGKNL